jgi:hypothetical protein
MENKRITPGNEPAGICVGRVKRMKNFVYMASPALKQVAFYMPVAII